MVPYVQSESCPFSYWHPLHENGQDFLDTEYIQERSTTEAELRNKMRRLEDDYAAKMREREAMLVTRRVRTTNF